MQKFTYSETPSPHVIIDEFLPPRLASKCLEEVIALEPFYEQAMTSGDNDLANHMDNCEKCKTQFNQNRLGIRDNSVVYLDKQYENFPDKSTLLNSIHDMLKNEYIVETLAKYNPCFRILKHTITTENVMSRYGKCDFYGWHLDTMPHNIAGRVITLVYYLNTEPEKFEGGEIILGSPRDVHTQKSIQPKHNRAVFFESNEAVHAVDTVKLNGDFKDGRFSLNCWIGFSGARQYR